MPKLRNIVYLSEAQKQTLFTDGTITVGTTTVDYSDNDIYVVQQLWNTDGSNSNNYYIKDNTGTTRFTVSSSGMATAAGFSGSGASLTNLNADNIATGTINLLRLPAEVWTSYNLTNLNQLTNGPGYITSYTETDPVFSAWNKSTGISILTSQISDITATATEINKLDGFTGTYLDLDYAKDLRATGVTATEFDYIDGVTSNIQTQLNGKEPTIATKNTAFNKNYGTTATDVKMNGTQAVGTVDAVARIDHVHPVDTSRQAVITGGASTITSSNLTASRALISDAYGKVDVSATTSTQLGYLSGASSNIQSQLDGKVAYIDALMPTNPFGGKKVYLNHTDNAFFAMDKKATVVITRHATSYGGNTYPMLNPNYVALYTVTGSGTTRQITETPYPSNIVVYENDVLKTSPANYSYNSTTGLITFVTSPSGTIYVYPGAEIPQYLDSPSVEDMSSQAYKLFDGSYETNIQVTFGYYLKIKMTYDGTNYSNFDSIFGAYKYGTIYASYYYTGTPLEAHYRVYNYSYRPHTPGWKQTAFSAYTGATTSAGYIGNVSDEGNHGRSIMEVIVVGHDTTDVPENPFRGMNPTQITQLDLKLTRPTLSLTGSTVTKFGTNKLFYDLKLGDRLSDNIVLGVNGTITSSRITSTVATGTAPFTVASTTLVSNLNADLLDGKHASDFSLSTHNHDTAYAPLSHIHTIGYYSTASVSDLNTTLGTGQFSWNSSSTNIPVASSFGQGINIVSSGTAHNNSNNWITQLAFSTANNTAYFRGKTNAGSWGSWYTFYHTGNKPTATDVGLGNVTNESKATMFTSPTFTGTVSGVTASMVGLGNVTNESKTTMFTNPVFTGTTNIGSGSNTWTIDDATANVLTFKDGANTRLEIKAGGLYVNGSTTALGSGTVTSVTGTSPIASSGGTTPIISVASGFTIPTSTEKGQYDTAYTGVNTATNANTASTIVKRDASGNFSAGTITANLTGTASGNLTSSSTLDASKLSGTIPSAVLGNSTHYIGTTAVTLNRASASLALTGVTNTNWDSAYTHSTTTTGAVHGATTVGNSFFRLTNPSAITFPRINADNTVTALSAADFRTAIGAGTSSTTGTVTSVGGTGTVSGITLTGTVTTTGNLTLGGSISGLTTSNLSASAGIVNGQLANSSITVGTTAISLGGSATTITGLTSVTSTTLTTGVGTQTWQITDSGSDLLFQSGTTPVTKATLYNNGDLTITGKLSATSKSFLIDHPTKPGYKLQYGSLEGPENGVYVRGRLTNNNIIELPDYWTNLVDEDSITVTLTAIGKAQKLFVENIKNNKIYIKNSNRIDKNINCFYVVYGERKDVDKLEVEMEAK